MSILFYVYSVYVNGKRKDAGRILPLYGFFASVNCRRGCEERIYQKNQKKYFQSNALKTFTSAGLQIRSLKNHH